MVFSEVRELPNMGCIRDMIGTYGPVYYVRMLKYEEERELTVHVV